MVSVHTKTSVTFGNPSASIWLEEKNINIGRFHEFYSPTRHSLPCAGAPLDSGHQLPMYAPLHPSLESTPSPLTGQPPSCLVMVTIIAFVHHDIVLLYATHRAHLCSHTRAFCTLSPKFEVWV